MSEFNKPEPFNLKPSGLDGLTMYEPVVLLIEYKVLYNKHLAHIWSQIFIQLIYANAN